MKLLNIIFPSFKIKFLQKNKNYILAFLLGILSVFSFTPFNLFYFSIISFSLLMILCDNIKYNKNNKNKKFFLIGLYFGYGHFLFGLYWISISLIKNSNFIFLLPFAISLIPLAASLFIAILFWLFSKLTKSNNSNNKIPKIIIFTLLWVIIEMVRSIIFPWNIIGSNLMIFNNIAQILSLFGIYFLSILSLLLSFSLYIIIAIYQNKFAIRKNISSILYLLSLIIILLACYYYGINHKKQKITYNKDYQIRLVQANIDEQDKIKNNISQLDIFKTHLQISSDNLSGKNIKYIIFPESAISFILDISDFTIYNKFSSYINNYIEKDITLISGFIRVDKEQDRIKDIYNSLFTYKNNYINNYYDKKILVPFGEYIPKIFSFLSPITMSFSKGEEYKIIKLDDFNFLPLICYEIIFPIINYKFIKESDIIINITNDSWFGNSTGPYQHFLNARIRAIEYGIPIIRLSNNGISAIIDPFGNYNYKSLLNKQDIIDVNLISKIKFTFYSKHNNIILILIIILSFITIILFKRYR